MRANRFLTGALAASALVGHVIYPVTVWAASRMRRAVEVPPVPLVWPGVSVVIPAYLEAGVIGAKIANVQANGYAGDLEVLVVADGDPRSAEAARTAGATVVLLEERGGKAQALNRGIPQSANEIIVLTDANNSLEPGAIEKLVRWFSSPEVGAVAGEKLEGAGGELAYWRFESWIKRSEASLGTTLGLDAGFCAVRRSAWRPIPDDISNDDFWLALDVMDRGLRVAYEPSAVVREDSIGSLALSWERRTRVVAGGLWIMWRKRHLLSPRRGLVSAEIWGHKLWRSSGGPASHLALLVIAVFHLSGSTMARLFLLGHAAAVTAIVAEEKGVRLPLPGRVAAQALYLQVVALGGLARFLRGDRVLRWSKPSR